MSLNTSPGLSSYALSTKPSKGTVEGIMTRLVTGAKTLEFDVHSRQVVEKSQRQRPENSFPRSAKQIFIAEGVVARLTHRGNYLRIVNRSAAAVTKPKNVRLASPLAFLEQNGSMIVD